MNFDKVDKLDETNARCQRGLAWLLVVADNMIDKTPVDERNEVDVAEGL